MWGVNVYTGGHFDLYIADYYDYKVRPSHQPHILQPVETPTAPLLHQLAKYYSRTFFLAH
jgi:hypothetical protein